MIELNHCRRLLRQPVLWFTQAQVSQCIALARKQDLETSESHQFRERPSIRHKELSFTKVCPASLPCILASNSSFCRIGMSRNTMYRPKMSCNNTMAEKVRNKIMLKARALYSVGGH